MFTKKNRLCHALSTLGLIGLFSCPAISLASPELGSNCTQCHSSSEEEVTAEPITNTETTTNTESSTNTETPTTVETTTDTVPMINVEITTDTESTTNTETTIETETTTDSETTTTLETCQADPDRRSCRLIAEYDLDQNGQIELAEVKAAREVFFDEADTDQSADLTAEELQVAKEAQRQTLLEERFYELDSNDDGVLSEDELQLGKFGKTNHLFWWLDADGDGSVTLEEFQATPTKGFDGYGCGEAKLSRLDNDGDGLISKEEFVNNVPLFDKFDADENGVLTLEELEEVSDGNHKKGFSKGKGGFSKGGRGHSGGGHSKGSHFRH